ncbi:hypothetical protein AZ003_002804 [Citrobacter freundii]|nr:hypothetical protein AZ003_002804 [Citrobacter freundii]
MILEVLMVPKAGLEPARISTVDFESKQADTLMY